MPQPELHVVLAENALARWSVRAATAPFDARDGACRNAFLHGSLAPDMGLFPGAVPLVSRCVHRGGSSDVGRRLLAVAASPVERAFAWGWIAHVLADARVHPLINQGGKALLAADGGAADADAALVAHIRIELGVEGWYALQRRAPRRTRLVHVFDRDGIGDLVAALHSVYAVPFDTGEILAAHRNVTTFATWCSQLAELLACDLESAEQELPAHADFLRMPGVRRVASSVFPRTSPIFGFLNPVRPEPWLLELIDAEVCGFTDRLDELVAGAIQTLPNYDLNTGRELLPIECVACSPRVA